MFIFFYTCPLYIYVLVLWKLEINYRIVSYRNPQIMCYLPDKEIRQGEKKSCSISAMYDIPSWPDIIDSSQDTKWCKCCTRAGWCWPNSGWDILPSSMLCKFYPQATIRKATGTSWGGEFNSWWPIWLNFNVLAGEVTKRVIVDHHTATMSQLWDRYSSLLAEYVLPSPNPTSRNLKSQLLKQSATNFLSCNLHK